MFQFFRDTSTQKLHACSNRRLELETHTPLQIGSSLWPQAPIAARRDLWRIACRAFRPPPSLDYLLDLQVPEDVLNSIDKDVARTFPEHEYFSQGSNQRSNLGDLQSILRAYAAVDPEVLYVLLLHHNMRALYLPDLRELQDVMESVLLAQSKELQLHFHKCGVVRSMFLPTWIMTVFSADFHPSITARLLDVMLVSGWRATLTSAAASLILVAGDWLLKAQNMESVVDIFKEQIPALALPILHQVLTWALQQCHDMAEPVEDSKDTSSSSGSWTRMPSGTLPVSVPATQASLVKDRCTT